MINIPSDTSVWQDQLQNQGYVYLPQQTEIQLTKILKKLGQIINQTDVTANPNFKTTL